MMANRVFLGVWLLLLSSACSGPTVVLDEEQLLGQEEEGGDLVATMALAEAAWEQRQSAEAVVEALELWQACPAQASPEVSSTTRAALLAEVYTYQARAHFFLANQLKEAAELSEEQQAKHFEEGRKFAEKALALIEPEFASAAQSGGMEEAAASLEADAAEALYWWTVNTGAWLQFQKPVERR